MYVYIDSYNRNWFKWLWNLRSHTVCHLQGEPWKLVVEFRVPRPENRGGGWSVTQMVEVLLWDPRSETWDRWCQRAEDGCSSSSKHHIDPSPTFSLFSGPQWVRWYPPALVGADLFVFTQSPYSEADPFQRRLHRTPRNNNLPLSGPHLAQSGWHKRLAATKAVEILPGIKIMKTWGIN